MRLIASLALLAGILGTLSTAAETAPPSGKYWVFVGTYTSKNGSQGIYRMELDAKTGQLSPAELAGEAVNPSFLDIHPSGKFLYSCGEIANFDKKGSGSVSAFALDPKTGSLKPLNTQAAGGSGPCHVSVDRTGKMLLVANYGGGSVASLPILENGQLGEAASVIKHTGSSINPSRQKEPHAHCIRISPDNKLALAADLGTDQVLVYRIDPSKATLTPNDPPYGKAAPGSGPRHLAYHPSLPVVYVNNELLNSVTAYAFEPATGKLTPKQTLTTLPGEVKGNSTAETVVHPSGKFLYVSNRGHNSIAGFSLDPKTGEMTSIGHATEGIKVPRNFNIDPTGRWMLVANQEGDSVIVFAIDAETGKLTPTDSKAVVAKPVCVRFMAKP